MVAFAIKDVGGLVPRTKSRNLAANMAEQAWNCDLSSGDMEGLPQPVLVKDFSALNPAPSAVLRAYRIPDPTGSGNPDVWLPLPHQFSSVCRSPLANDTSHRYYWTNPGFQQFFWATYAMLQAGTDPYNVGTVQPDPVTSSLSISVSGGTTDGSIPLVSRSYTWTYINAFGEESAPNAPSAIVTGPPDGTWTIHGLPLFAPANPPGLNYPPITGVALYRTVTGTQSGAQFFQVWVFLFPPAPTNNPTDPYIDTLLDQFLVNNLVMPSASWANPPDTLDGLTALPGGMLVGFTGNTVHFCEPNRPHAWPAGYDQSVHYDIVGFGVWQQNLVALTSGFPSTGTGNSPSNYLFTQVRVPEPCISRGSIITDLLGVYYASQNGIVMLNYFGMQNQTLTMVTKNIWLTTFDAPNIVACRHRSQYLAINPGSAQGFLVDYTEPRMGMMMLSTFANVSAVWNDEYTGDAYICDYVHKKIYLWDSPSAGPLIYRWRSKQFYGSAPANLGACQISSDPNILSVFPSDPAPLNNGDPLLVLPPGVNAVFNLYAGPDGQHLVLTKNLTSIREIFRLPSGFKAFDWQCEIIARCGIRSIELASTMKELKGV